ncbi:MAG: hypothetical protein VKI42_06005 [Synechococcaceae cyanobacterium]|nr:hypothetical protein [Synechococcaceae cyanobacterium]
MTAGYPEALHRSSESRRQAWARSSLKAILHRDVRHIASVDALQSLPQLLTALAQACGLLCNLTQLGARIGFVGKTLTRYIRSPAPRKLRSADRQLQRRSPQRRGGTRSCCK